MSRQEDNVSDDVLQERIKVTSMLSGIGQQLDKRYRKMTQLGAISRDITWESKRAISQCLGHFQNKSALCNAEKTLNHVLTSPKCLRGLALCLVGEDMNLFGRNYTACLQEFIEAFALITFFKHGNIIEYEDVLKALTIPITVAKTDDAQEEETINFSIRLSRKEFYMGLLDITGELVRACASVVYTPDFKSFLFKSLALVRMIYRCTSTIYPLGKELLEKVTVMRQSMIKLEVACFDCLVGRKTDQLLFSKQVKVNPEEARDDHEDSGYER